MPIVLDGSGEISGLDEINNIAVPTVSFGKVLQVVSAFKNDVFSTTSTTFVDATGFTATITPSQSTNKILCLVNATLGISGQGRLEARLLRDATVVAAHTGLSGFADIYPSRWVSGTDFSSLYTPVGTGAFTLLDTPTTTSATTYKVQIKVSSGQTGVVNKSAADGYAVSSITLMEISA